MMTSTFPTTKSNSYNLKNGIKEIQTKKEVLMTLEAALKKRVNEFRELCLKEGELTGHLPLDYPLQPREPIPQVRRRITQSYGNIYDDRNNVAQPRSVISRTNELGSVPNRVVTFSIPTNVNAPFPSRPTSTNSTSSSTSTASSNTKSINQALTSNGHNQTHFLKQNNSSSSNEDSRFHHNNNLNNHPDHGKNVPMSNNFKRPFNLPTSTNFDSDSLSNVRASSTASSSSSSGSAALSTVSTSALLNQKTLNGFNNMNLHARSYSESLTSDNVQALPSNHTVNRGQINGTQALPDPPASSNVHGINNNTVQPPSRPPRGLINNGSGVVPKSASHVDNKAEPPSVKINGLSNGTSEQQESLVNKPITVLNANGVTNIQPYQEETKPFQMSDFYKYSSKHRQKASVPITYVDDQPKTTRQLQEEGKKNLQRFASSDQHYQASLKLMEQSGQKLMEATAKAIAANPGLAEKLNSILPGNGERY